MEKTTANLYSNKVSEYEIFVSAFLYPQGLKAFFSQCGLLKSNTKVLDAGCGTGIVSLALTEAFSSNNCSYNSLNAFDLSPAMLARFQAKLDKRNTDNITLHQANVLTLQDLPTEWKNYDLIVSASMLEYVPREKLVAALSGLRELLSKQGTFLLFITKKNILMDFLIGYLWSSNLYSRQELTDIFSLAGFTKVTFKEFPLSFKWLDLWGYIIEAS
ncbi:MAG: class I SAM-dependent methyltransferase [Blastocatellia bacterium]